MNTNNIPKLFLSTLLAHTMCMTVILSHMHAKDAVSMTASAAKLAHSDITAKALGDLHHHIDKTSLKNVTGDQSATTAGRSRGLNPLDALEEANESLMTRVRDFLLRLRLVASLCFQLA